MWPLNDVELINKYVYASNDMPIKSEMVLVVGVTS